MREPNQILVSLGSTVSVATIVVVSAGSRQLSCNKAFISLMQRSNASAGVRMVGKKNLIATCH